MRGSSQPGALLGRYQLTDRLAIGGMAELYRAVMTGAHDFHKPVVIKKILPHLAADDEFVAMFIDEAKLTAQLQHPKIVQVFELGRLAEGELFIAMEYVDGVDVLTLLRDFARRRQRMVPELAVHIVHEVLDALDYAHNALGEEGEPLGIVHRDISPGNVLVSVRGNVKLTDFGIARAAANQSQTNAGTLKGKYGYMSPEQVVNATLDGRSDVFSCGVLLAEMLMGRRLFIADSELDVLLMVRDVRLERLHKYGRDIDDALQPILQKALRRSPADRFQSALELREALADWMFHKRLRISARDLSVMVADVKKRSTPKDAEAASASARALAAKNASAKSASAAKQAPAAAAPQPAKAPSARDRLPTSSEKPLARTATEDERAAAPPQEQAAAAPQPPKPPVLKQPANPSDGVAAAGKAASPPAGVAAPKGAADAALSELPPMRARRSVPDIPVAPPSRKPRDSAAPEILDLEPAEEEALALEERPSASRKDKGDEELTDVQLDAGPAEGDSSLLDFPAVSEEEEAAPEDAEEPRTTEVEVARSRRASAATADRRPAVPIDPAELQALVDQACATGDETRAFDPRHLEALVRAAAENGDTEITSSELTTSMRPGQLDELLSRAAGEPSGGLDWDFDSVDLPLEPPSGAENDIVELGPAGASESDEIRRIGEASGSGPRVTPVDPEDVTTDTAAARIRDDNPRWTPDRDPESEGDLTEVSPLHVVYRLAAARATGMLHVNSSGTFKNAYFVDGVPQQIASSVPSERLGEFLISQGVISEGELSMALAVMPQFGGQLGDTLIGLGLITPLKVVRALADQVAEKLLDVCAWSSGRYQWYNGQRAQHPSSPLHVDVWEVLGVASRKLDRGFIRDWFVERAGQVPAGTGHTHIELESFQLGSRPKDILELLDGTRSVEELSQMFPRTEIWEDAARVLYLLVQTDLAQL